MKKKYHCIAVAYIPDKTYNGSWVEFRKRSSVLVRILTVAFMLILSLG